MFRKYSNLIIIYENINLLQGFAGGSVVKKIHLPGRYGCVSWVWKDPLEEGMATHSSIPA